MLMKADRAVLARSAPREHVCARRHRRRRASSSPSSVFSGGHAKSCCAAGPTQEEYSHGFLIPVIAAWLLWTRREALATHIGRAVMERPAAHFARGPAACGRQAQLALPAAAARLHPRARRASCSPSAACSLLKVTLLPIAFLLFAIPLPYVVDAGLSLQLQLHLLAARRRLHPAVQHPGLSRRQCHRSRRLQAAGGRGLQRAALSLSADEPGLPRRLSVPGAALAARAGVPVDHPDHDCDEQPAHRARRHPGRSFRSARCRRLPAYVRGLDHLHRLRGAARRAKCIVLARFVSGKKFFDVFYPPKLAGRIGASSPHRTPAYARRCSRALLLLSRHGRRRRVSSRRGQEIIPERKLFVAFPTTLGEWRGRTSSLDAQTEHGLGLTDYILSDYAKRDGRSVNLYVAYYANQRTGSSPHSPAVCIPGNGWLITDLERTHYASAGSAACRCHSIASSSASGRRSSSSTTGSKSAA